MSITKISPSVVDFDDGITITVDDNSDALTLTSTDADASIGPVLNLYRNSSSPADVDLVGSVKYVARNDNSQDVTTFTIQNYITDVSDGTEDAASFFYLMEGGALRERLGFGSSATVFNEDGVDVDFRIESDNSANALFVDGGQNAIGIQTATEHDGTALVYPLTINAGNHSGNALEVHRTTNSRGYWYASDTGTHYLDVYGSSSPNLRFRIAGSDVAKVTADGICFGSDTATANALNDYEEGTWTPAIGSSGGSTPNYTSTAVGDYVKVGSIVHASFLIIVTGVTDNGGSGNKIVSGLPFSQNQNSYQQVGVVGYNDVWGDAVTRFYITGSNLTLIPTGTTQSNYTGVITTGYFSGSITYSTDD